MKTLFCLTLLIAGFTQVALADKWPYDPICRQAGATSETVKVDGKTKPVVLCQFGMSSMIDNGSIRQIGFNETMAVQNYKAVNDSNPFADRDCRKAGAQLLKATASNGRLYKVCYFFDSSVMEEETFIEGPESSINWELNAALGVSNEPFK